MKKEIFDTISLWHQEQKKKLAEEIPIVSSVLLLDTLSSTVSGVEQVEQVLSEKLGDDIQPSMIFWGVPYSLHAPCPDLKISSGYAYWIANLGWILIWKNDNKIFFLDKNLFGMEKCFNFHSKKSAYATLIQDIKIRAFIILILMALAALCILLN